MTNEHVLVVRVDDGGCTALTATDTDHSLTTVHDLRAAGQGYDHIALLPDGKVSEISALSAAIASVHLQRDTMFLVPDQRSDYELRQQFSGGRPEGIVGFTTTGHAGFVIETTVLDLLPAELSVTQSTLPALVAASLELVGTQAVLNVPARDGGEYLDRLVDSPKLYSPDWYTSIPSAWNALFDAVMASRGRPSTAMQAAFLYDIQWRLYYAANFGYKQVLTEDDIDSWWDTVAKILRLIDVDVIASTTWKSRLPGRANAELLRLKGVSVSRDYSETNIVLRANDHVVGELRAADATIELMKLIDGRFTLMGYLTFPLSDGERLTATVGSEQHELTDCGRFTDYEVFGRVWFRHFAFDVRLPRTVFDARNAEIALTVTVDNHPTVAPVRLNFRRQYSKLMNTRAAYWATDGLIFHYGPQRVRVTPARPATLVIRELMLWGAIAYAAGRHAAPVIGLRALYWLARLGSRWRRPVWLFADKMITAGDNGEYAFNYARLHGEGISPYYVLDRRSKDAERLTAEGTPFVRYGSIRHKLLFLTAETVFLTHTVSTLNNSFPRGVEKFFRGLFNGRIVFIQHGLSVQHLPRILNKAFDGVDRYCIASPVERTTLELPSYGYRSDELVNTGLARFDGLVDRAGNSIVISPTWRNYLALPTNSSDASTRHRGGSANFASSSFFAIYERLLTDAHLLAAARATGTRITFLLHPFISAQRELFERFANDVVDIIAATDNVSYEDLLTSCCALVTDYSGIQFDVAFMRKPVVYFQPRELPPSYREAIFTYAQHALGPIATTHDEIVAAITDVMESRGEMGQRYSERVDTFFYFHDHDNSRRIYELARALTRTATHR